MKTASPPAARFVPKLVRWYDANAAALQLQVVFVSSDHDDGACDAIRSQTGLVLAQ